MHELHALPHDLHVLPDLGWTDVEVDAEAGGCQARHHGC